MLEDPSQTLDVVCTIKQTKAPFVAQLQGSALPRSIRTLNLNNATTRTGLAVKFILGASHFYSFKT